MISEINKYRFYASFYAGASLLFMCFSRVYGDTSAFLIACSFLYGIGNIGYGVLKKEEEIKDCHVGYSCGVWHLAYGGLITLLAGLVIFMVL